MEYVRFFFEGLFGLCALVGMVLIVLYRRHPEQYSREMQGWGITLVVACPAMLGATEFVVHVLNQPLYP
jgi:hypothetical protein